MRQKGFYWVKLFDVWTIAHWYGEHWGQVLGYDYSHATDNDFQDIDERRIERELCKPEPDTVDDRLINDFYSQFKWEEFIR